MPDRARRGADRRRRRVADDASSHTARADDGGPIWQDSRARAI